MSISPSEASAEGLDVVPPPQGSGWPRLAAGVMLAGTVLLGGCAGAEQPAGQPASTIEQVPTTYDLTPKTFEYQLSPDKVADLEANYPTARKDYSPRDQVFAEHTYSSLSGQERILYSHKGLPGLNFSRPSTQANEKIIMATTLPELEDAADAFLGDLGLDISFDDPAITVDKKPVTPTTPESFAAAHNSVTELIGFIATQPRELTMLANARTILLTPALIPYADETGAVCDPDKVCSASGMTVSEAETNKSNLVVSFAPGIDVVTTFKHEEMHAIREVMDARDPSFSKGYAALNPAGFKYKEQRVAEGMKSEDYLPLAQQAVDDRTVASEYATSTLGEDISETFENMGEGKFYTMPGREYDAFGKPLGLKRTYLIEALSTQVQNLKEYWIERFVNNKYAPERILEGFKDLYNINRQNATWPDAPDGPHP